MVLFSLSIVRHGETGANRAEVIQGQSEEPLTAGGEAQARALGAALSLLPAPAFTHAFASDLQRASSTANILLGQLAESPPLETDPRLRERCYGCFERRSFSDLAAAQAAAATLGDCEAFVPDGGESNQDVHNRIVHFFRDLCARIHAEVLSGPQSGLLRPATVRKVGSRSSNLVAWEEESLSNSAFDEDAFDTTLEAAARFPSEAPKRRTSSDTTDEFSPPNTSSVDSGILSDGSVLTVDTSGGPIPSPASVPLPTNARRGASLLSPGFLSSGAHPLPFSGPGSRKISMQSIASDDSYFPDVDAKVIVVSHGGTIRELIRYFHDHLGCNIPGGRTNALRAVPNTGVASFMVCYEGEELVSLTCLDVHSKDHLLDQQQFQSQHILYPPA